MDKAQDHMRQLLVTLDADNDTVAENVEAALESRRWVLRRDASAPDPSALGASSAHFASSASLAEFKFGSNAQDSPGIYYENVKTKEKVFTKSALSRRWHAATLLEQTLNNGEWRQEDSAASGNKYFRNTRTGEIIPTERQLEERLLMTDAVSKERDVYVQALEALADRRMPEYVMGLLRYARDTFQPYEVRLKALELLRSTIVIFPEPLQKGSEAEKKRNQLFLRWKECSLESRTGLKEDLLDLKEELLATLASPEPIVRDTVALLISTFASLELPEGQWPELFRTLFNAGAKDDEEVVSAVILTMKYIAQAITHTPQLAEAIITVGDGILETFCKAMARAQTAVQINALETLYHCLPCLHGHMEEQQQRDYLLGVVCTAAADQMLSEGIREKAMACLVRIAYLYYHPQFLGRYKSDLIEITLRAIERRVDPSALETAATLGQPELTSRSRGSRHMMSMQATEVIPAESDPSSPTPGAASTGVTNKTGSFSSSMDHSALDNAAAAATEFVEDTDAVAIQAIQFWSVICTTERDLREADGSSSSRSEQVPTTGLPSSSVFFGNQNSRTSMEFCTSAFNNWNKRQGLANILFNAMLKQPDTPPSDGSIPLSSAASKALLLLCQAVGDPIVGLLGARINSHMERVEWRSKEAACMALGCMLHGPNPAVVQTYVENRASQLLDLLGDSNDLVADTAGWCVALICDRFVDVFAKNHDVMQRLLNAVNPMFRRQAARALRAAQIIHNLSLQFEDDDDLYFAEGDNQDSMSGGYGLGQRSSSMQNDEHDYPEVDLGRSVSSGDHRGTQSRGQRASGQPEQQNSISQSMSMAVGSASPGGSGNAKRTRNELFSLNYEIFISLLLGNTHREGGQLRFETQEAMNALICAAPRHAKARMALKDLMTELMNELESYLKLINETKSVPNPDWLKQVSLICTGLGHLSRKLGPFEENFAVRHPYRSFDLMMKTIKLGHPPITIEALLVIGLMIEAMGPGPFRLSTGNGAGSYTTGQGRIGTDRFGMMQQQGLITGSNTLGSPLMRTDSNLSGCGVNLGGEQSVVPKQDVPEQLVNQLFDVLTDCLRAGFPSSKATTALLHHSAGSPGAVGVAGLAASPINPLTPSNRQVEDSLCIAAITAVIDIANGWKEMFADRLDSILKELDLLLRDESVSLEIQSVIIGTFGDLILATKESFSRALPEVMALLGGPIEIRAQNLYIATQTKSDRRKWELTAEIHESLCNCYAAMLQGLKGRLGDLHPYIKHIVQFAAQVALKFPSGPVETQRAAISLIGIAAFVVSQDSTSHKGQFKAELTSPDVTAVLKIGGKSLNEAVNEAAQFALEEVASLGLMN
jgi:hypothetical protein